MNLLREKVLSKGGYSHPYSPIPPPPPPKKQSFTFAHYTFSAIRKPSLHFNWKPNNDDGEVQMSFLSKLWDAN